MTHSYLIKQITPHDSQYLIPNKIVYCLNKAKIWKKLGNEFLAACERKMIPLNKYVLFVLETFIWASPKISVNYEHSRIKNLQG